MYGKVIHYTEWAIGALLTVVFGLQYSVEIDLINTILGGNPTAIQVVGLLAFLAGSASAVRLSRAVIEEIN